MKASTSLLPALFAAALMTVACDSRSDEPERAPRGLVPVDDAPASAPPAAEAPLPVAVGSTPTGSVPLEAGRQYAAGTRVDSAADGVSFVVPVEWLGGLSPGSAAFMFGSHTRAGLGLAIMRPATSWQEIEAFLNQPQDLGEGVVLYPDAPGRRTQRGYEIALANSIYSGLAIGRLGDSGNGVVVFFGGPLRDREYYGELAARTADSVAFAAPRESAAAQQWRAHLGGMMLTQRSSYYSSSPGDSYVGGSSSRTLHLCSDGSYAYLSSSNVAADAGGGTSGYGGGGGAELGRWSVETIGDRVLLTLRSNAGELSQHAVQVQGDATYVDGERAYRVQSDRCS